MKSSTSVTNSETGHVYAHSRSWLDGLFHSWHLDNGRWGITFSFEKACKIVFDYGQVGRVD